MTDQYTYTHASYIQGVRSYVTHVMDVAVVSEKGNRYQIKYLGQHANGALIGSLHWVRKDKVTRVNWPHTYTATGADGTALTAEQLADIKPRLGYAMREAPRLPYKDD